ncbi:MAG: hypothetical protein WDN49_14885 [Acetobacteraceae bacterium]
MIGAIYPLTGNAAQIGIDAEAAVGVITDIINTDHGAHPDAARQGRRAAAICTARISR